MNCQRILLQYISLLRICTQLNTLHGTLVVSVEDADLLPVLRVPDVDPSVARTRDDELRVGGEGGLQRKLLGVQMSCDGVNNLVLVKNMFFFLVLVHL